jgi:hypothetical protein
MPHLPSVSKQQDVGYSEDGTLERSTFRSYMTPLRREVE